MVTFSSERQTTVFIDQTQMPYEVDNLYSATNIFKNTIDNVEDNDMTYQFITKFVELLIAHTIYLLMLT
jgi:hypothetical protein